MSCGFFAYDLWDIVQRRLYNPRAPSILFHHVAVLVCFTTALYRGVGINYLVLLMASEINSVFGHQRRMLRLLGVPDGGLVSTMNWVCNWFTFIAARVVPCALLSVLLILDWGSFPIMFFIVSSIGMTCVNLLNVQLFTSLLKAYCHDMQTRDGLHLDHGSRKED
ncbi:hypothetical protein CBR_g40088 [Chara braunii]|uniref:TLC domain-containing protein n=1 Tax=Chara braunii TaxID=69332 RepID=A0A388LSZ7_CHABU|nr:hypothetical protein CBR_g40088 [Chara braunii]|eukprot:GBG85446.1 hypothetical protein CBR_g40088 [Chara braunii]